MFKRGLFGLLFIFTFVISISSLYVQAASDGTPPVVVSIEVLTKEVVPGGKIKIKVTASDDVSGIKLMAFMFKSPSDNAIFQPLLYLEPSEPLEGTYTFESDSLNAYAETGDWDLVLVRAEDFAGNSISYHASHEENNFIQNIGFTVDPNAQTEEIEIDDGFEALETKKDVQLNKEFTITFNMDIDISTILERNIYVLDRQGSRVPLLFIIDRGQDLATSKVTVAPVGVYRADSSYTLYIKDVKSTTGKILSQNTKMNFTTK